MTRRSRIEMKIDILKYLYRKPRSRLTHMMYAANVNCSELKKIVAELESKHLMKDEIYCRDRIVKGNRVRVLYSLTNEGIEFLANYEKLLCIINSTTEVRSSER